MKATFLFLLAFLPFFGFAQNDTLLLLPQLGKEYIYEYTESEYTLNDDSTRFDPREHRETLRLQYDEFEPGKEPYLKVTVSKSISVKPGAVPLQITDYKFPAFVDGIPVSPSVAVRDLLFAMELQFSIDSVSNQLSLLNRTDLLLKAREVLRSKGIDEDDIRRNTEFFNENLIPSFTNKIQSFFKVPVLSLEGKDVVEDYKTNERVVQNVKTIERKKSSLSPGLLSQRIVVDEQSEQLLNFDRIVLDTVNRKNRLYYRLYNLGNHKLYQETNIQLMRVTDLNNRKVRISGKLEKLLSKKVTLSKLQKSFGTELQQQVFYCDADNSFEIEIELEHPQLIFLQFGFNSNQGLPTLLLYVEPGSEIHFDATGNTFPWNITFSGELSKVEEMIYEYRTSYPVFNERVFINFTLWLNLTTNNSMFEEAVKGVDDFCEKYKNKIPGSAFQFVKTELKNQLSIGAYDFLIRTRLSEQSWGFISESEINPDFLKAYVDSYNINLNYNSYGIFSRQAAISYCNYSFETDRNVMGVSYYSLPFSAASAPVYTYDLPIEIESAKMILAGASLYNVLADKLVNKSRRLVSVESKRDEHEQRKVNEYFDLMLRLCNDKTFGDEISAFVSAQSKWSSDDYVPDTKFFNPDGKEVLMKDFLGKKPTIFYVSLDWAVSRYSLDKASIENPDINYVMVVEGSNFKEWTDYLKAAEPKANQLLLMNTDANLTDIFKMQGRTFLLYNKDGKRLGDANNPSEATNLIRKDMEQPKEKTINKSALITVIIVLVALLVLVVSVLLVWKWRVQQQFRKEQRERRLRELELIAIRSQMNPHFLFNSLNSGQNLVQKNMGREAHLYLADFAGLIRKVLNNSEKEEVSLAEELEMTEQYLRLEQLRFDFGYSMEIDSEIDVHNTLVSSMLLQPFVENAIVHGLQNKTSDRKLKITMKRRDSEIKIEIEDNGVGREAAKELSKTKNGKGTKLISERLQLLKEKQGEKYSLETIDLQEGTCVEIIIPEEN